MATLQWLVMEGVAGGSHIAINSRIIKRSKLKKDKIRDYSAKVKRWETGCIKEWAACRSREFKCFWLQIILNSTGSKHKWQYLWSIPLKTELELTHSAVQCHYQEPRAFQHSVCCPWLSLLVVTRWINSSGHTPNVDKAILSWRRGHLFPLGSF